MNHDQVMRFNKEFKKHLDSNSYSLAELYASATNLVTNPNRDNLITIYSDWQGHAAISMKRAVFTLTSLTLIQFFVIGEAFQLQTTWLPEGLTSEAYLRLKIAFISSTLVSLILYLTAIKRDKRIRDARVSALKGELKEFGIKYVKFRKLFTQFLENNDGELEEKHLNTILSGTSGITSPVKRLNEATSEYEIYDKSVRSNSIKQTALDFYDEWVIPALALLSMMIVALS